MRQKDYSCIPATKIQCIQIIRLLTAYLLTKSSTPKIYIFIQATWVLQASLRKKVKNPFQRITPNLSVFVGNIGSEICPLEPWKYPFCQCIFSLKGVILALFWSLAAFCFGFWTHKLHFGSFQPKMPFLGPISIFSRNYLFFGIIMCGHTKDTILC